MKRRNFLKSTALLGTVGTGMVSVAESCSHDKTKNPSLRYVNSPSEILELQVLENDAMKVQIFSNGVIKAFDKKNNQHWKTFSAAVQDETVIDEGKQWSRKDRAMGEQFPGRFIGTKEGENLRFTLYGRVNLLYGTFLCNFKLEDN